MDIRYNKKSFPPRIAELAFSMDVPDSWPEPEELPPITDDWSDPTLFAPLMIAVAPTSPIILSVMARPASSDGTLLDWVMFHIRSQKMTVGGLVEKEINGLMMITGCVYQPASDIGPRYLEIAFFEDGGRLVNLFISAPRAMEREITPVFDHILDSFRLDRVKGKTVKTMPEVSTFIDKSGDPKTGEARKPGWLELAEKMELDGRLEEMEATVKQAIPNAAYALEIARIYQERMRRLRADGDKEGASAAYQEATDWATAYPVMATSGGEAAAMCRECDEFRAQLDRDYVTER